MPTTNILIGTGFICFGLLLIVLGFIKNKRCSGRTVGRIIGVRECQETNDDGFNSYYYYPQFEYVVNGQIYRGEGNKGYSKSRKIQIGSDIIVYYNPKKPNENFTKGGGKRQLIAGFLFIAFGVVWIVATAMS